MPRARRRRRGAPRGTMGMRRPGPELSVRRCPPGQEVSVVERPEQLVELLPGAQPFIDREAEALAGAPRRGLVLVQDLSGEFDAASAAALAGAHLLAGLPNEVIARFDTDTLV